MKIFFKICCALFVSFSFCPSLAQYQDSVLQNKTAIDSLLSRDHLDSVGGFPKTFYSKGYKVRAAALQKLIRECIYFYEHDFPAKKFDVPLYILDSGAWSPDLFGAPYAMPNYLPSNNIIIIGAEKNALARLSGQPLTEDSDSTVSGYDYVALHELGHYFFIMLNHTRTKQKWFDEFLANYFLINFLEERKKTVVGKWIAEIHRNDLYRPIHRSINDFEERYDKVGPANYDWYQKKFMKLGFQLYPSYKLQIIKKVLSNYAPEGMALEALSLAE